MILIPTNKRSTISICKVVGVPSVGVDPIGLKFGRFTANYIGSPFLSLKSPNCINMCRVRYLCLVGFPSVGSCPIKLKFGRLTANYIGMPFLS